MGVSPKATCWACTEVCVTPKSHTVVPSETAQLAGDTWLLCGNTHNQLRRRFDVSGKGTGRVFGGAGGGTADDSATSIHPRHGMLIRLARHRSGEHEEAFFYVEVEDLITPIKVSSNIYTPHSILAMSYKAMLVVWR